jgi:hypothetical protein
MNSASLCSLAGRYENPIPPRCLAPIDFLKIPALLNQTHSLRSKPLGKANQNEALLWKIAVLGMKKPPVGAGNVFPSPMLVFYIPSCRKCLPHLGSLNISYFVHLFKAFSFPELQFSSGELHFD